MISSQVQTELQLSKPTTLVTVGADIHASHVDIFWQEISATELQHVHFVLFISPRKEIEHIQSNQSHHITRLMVNAFYDGTFTT